MMIIFELERVRELGSQFIPNESKSKPMHSNLNTLKSVEDDESYGGVYVPSKAVEGLIELQKALTYARTSSSAEPFITAKKVGEFFPPQKIAIG